MRVIVYDKNPGPGIAQWALKMTWVIGCWIQKLLGAADEVYGAASWDDAMAWLLSRSKPLESIQFWGHGSPGLLWNGGVPVNESRFMPLKSVITEKTVVWFRACSVFQGRRGYDFSERLANGLGCIVAAHTRIIGFFQGGLYARHPGSEPGWSITEGEVEPPTWWSRLGLQWGNRTVICFATKIPARWLDKPLGLI